MVSLQYTIDGSGAYVTSGAGAMVKTTTQTQDVRMQAKLNGDNWVTTTFSESNEANEAGSETQTNRMENQVQSSHSYETIFNQKVCHNCTFPFLFFGGINISQSSPCYDMAKT